MPQLHLDSGPLRLTFERLGDRYAHRFSYMADGVRELAASVEGTAADAWPPSPPLQELHFSTSSDGRPVALAVGRAGVQHWSVSFEPVAVGFVIDVACRVRGPVQLLASTYRLSDEVGDSHRLAGAWDDCSLDSESTVILRFVPASLDEHVCSVTRHGGQTTITPHSPRGDAVRTIRWKYLITADEVAAGNTINSPG